MHPDMVKANIRIDNKFITFMQLKAGLYIISTPIGNLEDISLRALFLLKNCDIIFCENSLSTQKLLQKHQIENKKLEIYNDHSGQNIRNRIKDLIILGKIVGLVSEAGTPLISDPGYKLVRFMHENNLHVDHIPGPCALIAAIVLSSMPTDKFYFGGFFARTDQGRFKQLKPLANLDATLIFYEAPTRLLNSLDAIKNTLGDREVAIVKEITKIFQTVIKDKISDLMEKISEIPLRGEYVVLISGKKIAEEITEETLSSEAISLHQKGLTAKDITKMLQEKYSTKLNKNEIYKILDNFK